MGLSVSSLCGSLCEGPFMAGPLPAGEGLAPSCFLLFHQHPRLPVALLLTEERGPHPAFPTLRSYLSVPRDDSSAAERKAPAPCCPILSF